MKNLLLLLFLMCAFIVKAQHDHGHNEANKHMHHRPVKELIKGFEEEDRMKTQKPYEVIALFGDLKGKTILDIGAGSGYFSFKLVEKGAKVIAGDVNDEFQEFIKNKMQEEHISADQMELRKLPFDSPALKDEEVEGVIIVNTYHHIDHRVDYFAQVRSGLKPGGMLMVVDFMKKNFEEKVHGPPVEMRIASEVVMQELKKSGFERLELDDQLLPHQYIVKAWK